METQDVEKIRGELIKALLETKDSKTVSGGSEITVYCPRCHHQHLNSGPHLYIGILGDGPLKFDCKHCQFQGVLTPNTLKELEINNPLFDEYLKIVNKQNRITKKMFGISDNDMNTSWIIPQEITPKNQFKINYLNDRVGTDFSKENLKKHKIVLDLKSFLNINKIKLDAEYQNYILEEVDKHMIGFLSYNNNILNFRNISSSKIKTRYVNIKINKNISYPFLYIPPSEVDVLTKMPFIVVSEGAFDILCIKRRFFPTDGTNLIFGAVGSSGSYKRAIKKLISITCFFGSEILIFSDSDVKEETYRNDLKDILSSCKIKLLYNTKNKDFGRITEDYSIKTIRL